MIFARLISSHIRAILFGCLKTKLKEMPKLKISIFDVAIAGKNNTNV